ncbi:hypothetical protein LPTSP4_16460 [Leptospira ryugenii]|uniref:Uncharacterized protein n=1 Tax=Leptospira ryugenii TaxID=1917863 RepID=A0A2P2DZR3_9LEPT|nr:Imm32 family immunity protein [Leptospira ryugenii]GBF50122.1 hypothetical protein LPTSP4_16460 [Leptospira ryugenii]
MLTVELNPDFDTVTIHGSPDRLRWLASLLRELAYLAEQNGRHHEHLMSANWGGEELDSEPQSSEGKLVDHVILYGWSP